MTPFPVTCYSVLTIENSGYGCMYVSFHIKAITFCFGICLGYIWSLNINDLSGQGQFFPIKPRKKNICHYFEFFHS